MPIKAYKPTSPGRRWQTVSTFEELTKGKKPEKSLLRHKKKWGGRNNRGELTVRHRGGGTSPKYRVIDFRRDKVGIPAKVAAIEYDPNRTARIALLHYLDGEKRYILAPLGVIVGDMLVSGPEAEIKPGNTVPIKNIPLGTVIHNIELAKGKGGQIARSAGTGAQLLAKEGLYAQVRMPRVKCATFRWNVPRPSVRLVTSNRAASNWVKPVASVTWAGVPPSAV